jgi:ATP-dependent Clp protease adaptor protein ClpS
MPSADDRSSKPVLTCSLCGKSQHDLSDLVGGPEAFVREFICDECVRSELAKSKSAIADHLGPQASSGTSTGSSMFEVRLLNDDHTPMEFVVDVLQEVFELEHDDAVRIMLQTHHEGSGGCGAFPREAAQAKAAQVMALARQHRHPLRCCCLKRGAP